MAALCLVRVLCPDDDDGNAVCHSHSEARVDRLDALGPMPHASSVGLVDSIRTNDKVAAIAPPGVKS